MRPARFAAVGVCIAAAAALGLSQKPHSVSPIGATCAAVDMVPSFHLLLQDTTTGLIYDMTISAESQAANQLSSADGLRLCGVGRVLSSSGDIAVERAAADFYVKAREVPDRLIEVAGTSVARFGRDSAPDVIQVAPGAQTDSSVGTVVSFARQAVATFEFGPEWNRRFDVGTTCAMMSDVYRVLLGAAATDRDLEPACDPTFGGCVAQADQTCGAGQVASVTWSCNRTTGETSCSFMCKPSP